MTADLMAQRQDLYGPPEDPVLIEVPAMRFLMTDGTDEPGGAQFTLAVQALYRVASTLKEEQRASGMDFEIMPLEGFFAAEDPEMWVTDGPVTWDWTLALRVPAQITPDHVSRAKGETAERGEDDALGRIRLEDLEEGLSAQIMHVGPYDQERPTVEKLFIFIAEKGYMPSGRHHEIYLSDPAHEPPSEWRTIIRHAVR